MTKKDLKILIKSDKKIYKSQNFSYYLFDLLSYNNRIIYKKIIITSRKYDYYKKHKRHTLHYLYYSRKLNILCRKYNINIKGNFGKNLKIYHENIIINQYSKIGNNLILHGNNCIGNNGKDEKACPTIGNNVEIGYGATIIGNIEIADNIIIGANSLVNKSFVEPGVVIAGNPARIIKNKNRG